MTRATLDRDHIFFSAQAARRLAVNKKTLDRMIRDGRIPEPNRLPENNWRYWTNQDMQELEELLEKKRERTKRQEEK